MIVNSIYEMAPVIEVSSHVRQMTNVALAHRVESIAAKLRLTSKDREFLLEAAIRLNSLDYFTYRN